MNTKSGHLFDQARHLNQISSHIIPDEKMLEAIEIKKTAVNKSCLRGKSLWTDLLSMNDYDESKEWQN